LNLQTPFCSSDPSPCRRRVDRCRIADQRIIASLSEEVVIPGAAEDQIIASPTKRSIIAAAGENGVVADCVASLLGFKDDEFLKFRRGHRFQLSAYHHPRRRTMTFAATCERRLRAFLRGGRVLRCG
jgi:hypothetical protein